MDQFHHHRRALLAVSTVLLLVSLGAITPTDAPSAAVGIKVSKPWIPWLLGLAWGYMMFVYHNHLYTHAEIRSELKEKLQTRSKHHLESVSVGTLPETFNTRFFAVDIERARSTLGLFWIGKAACVDEVTDDAYQIQKRTLPIPFRLRLRAWLYAVHDVYICKAFAWDYLMPIIYSLLCFALFVFWLFQPDAPPPPQINV